MHDFDNDPMIDLGDAVAETKGSSMVGIVDTLGGGYRPTAGFSTED